MEHNMKNFLDKKKRIDLDTIKQEDLLKLRICDLPIQIEGTWLQDCIQQLYKELDGKGINFKPECYLADEWLTPENEPVIGIPFYLAHPELTRLEKKMMLEAEGDTKDGCMKLLRHETGHVLSYAYRLHKKRKWRKIFGSPSQEYGDTYKVRPYSKSYVRHLEGYYAQFHPDEDFVETCAVWLTPGSEWQKHYAGWKALKKLQYVDYLIEGIKDKAPLVSKGRKLWHYRKLKITLKNFYRRKQLLRAEDFPDFHDDNLMKIFSLSDETIKGLPAANELLRKNRRRILNDIAFWTGEKKYVINDLLKDIVKRSRELKLIAKDNEQIILMNLTAYITTLIMNYLYTGWYRGDKKKRKK